MAKPLILILSSVLLLCYSVVSTLPVVRRAERKQLMVTEYGEISSIDISTATAPNKGSYHVEFITLEPNSLLLPVLLHADMVFYVHSGSGKLSWTGVGEEEDDEEEAKRVDLRKGDVYRLEPGSVFFLQSDLENERQKLRIHAIFSTTDQDIWEPWIGAYSSISDLVLGFDAKLLQYAFRVTEGVIEEITSMPKPPGIVHAPAPGSSEEKEEKKKKKKKSVFYELENRFLKVMAAEEAGLINLTKKSKKGKTFNILETDPDFQNCNGWSLTVDKGNYKTLKGSNMGVFMVNLTKGAMMGPHWNPMATEIAVVLEGEGMVRIVCASNSTGCKNKRFIVREGDVFVVPRFHPMAQMSFNNGSFVFMGFSTTSNKNHPQFLAGKRSIFQTLDRDVLALAFNTSNATIDQLLLAAQEDAIILECVSCAEEEFRLMVQEREREREEEESSKRQEEEKRKRQEEEEEERRRRQEEEERKRGEERREREEEARRHKEEESRREQEEARRQEEERQRRREEAEEEAQQRREEEERRQQEEARKEEEERERQTGGGKEVVREKDKRERKEEEGEGRRRIRREEEGGGEGRRSLRDFPRKLWM